MKEYWTVLETWGYLGEYSPQKALLAALKSYSRRELYTAKEAEDVELAGYKVIVGLLDWFKPLLIAPRSEFEAVLRDEDNGPDGGSLDLKRRMVHMLPEKHKKVYSDAVKQLVAYPEVDSDTKTIDYDFPDDMGSKYGEMRNAYEWFFRAHLIVDFISGMTDGFAVEVSTLFRNCR
ncbi:MAG: hypothetical protein IPJ30_12570 [Acidobacteria bacterium]|nr:hypothetical protein [Acidobacteriota bacterium]